VPSVTRVIFRVAAFCPAPQPLSSSENARADVITIVVRRMYRFSHVDLGKTKLSKMSSGIYAWN
jgi:hypothetical protein